MVELRYGNLLSCGDGNHPLWFHRKVIFFHNLVSPEEEKQRLSGGSPNGGSGFPSKLSRQPEWVAWFSGIK